MVNRRIKITIWITITIGCLVVLFLFNTMTPLVGDDFAHYYGAEYKHFSSFRDIIKGLCFLRKNINGRIFSHFFVFAFLCFPKVIFNVFNSFIAVFIPIIIFEFCLLQYL